MAKTILICEDDDLLVDLLEYRLKASGYVVAIARDGGEAMDCIMQSTPDAIVLDAMMPVLDGFEVLRRLRENPETRTTPVIVLSARKKEEDIVAALELGANDYVVKPFIPQELVARLNRLVGSAK